MRNRRSSGKTTEVRLYNVECVSENFEVRCNIYFLCHDLCQFVIYIQKFSKDIELADKDIKIFLQTIL